MSRAHVTISKTDFLAYLVEIGACRASREYVEQHPSDDAEEIYNACDVGAWLTWLLEHVPYGGITAWRLRMRIQQRVGREYIRWLSDGKNNPAWSKEVCDGVRARYPWAKLAAYLVK